MIEENKQPPYGFIKIVDNNQELLIEASNLTKSAITQWEKKYANGILKFNAKELNQMPTTFRKYLRAEGCTVFYRERKRSKKSITYEARYRRHGYNITKSAPTLELLKTRLIEAFKEADAKRAEQEKLATDNVLPNVPTTLNGFAEYYFENFYKRRVVLSTYKSNVNLFKKHLSVFKNRQINTITSLECQHIIDNLTQQGKFKTATEVKSLLNIIMVAAKKHNLLQHNPIDIVILDKYEKQHGKALSKDEEKQLLAQTAGTPLQIVFAIALYTGLRPNEYKTARIEGKFVVAINSKRKNGEIEYKKIPITPMLEPYLIAVKQIEVFNEDYLRKIIKGILPNHKLYDLRTTFYTRCQECGVAEVALKSYVGHALGGLADTYTDLSDEFLLKEAEKIKY